MGMPIHWRDTTCRSRRKFLEREERTLARQMSRHVCRDGKECSLQILEDILVQGIAEAAYENEVEPR